MKPSHGPKPYYKTVFSCPDCGSKEVHMYLAMWVDANSDKPVGDSDLAELYPDIYWCNHCEDHPLTLVETTVKEKPFNKPNVRQPCGHDGYKEVDGKPTCVYCGEEFEL